MSGESIRELVRAQPYEPFEVHLSGGEVHRVGHPEQVLLAGSQLYIYYHYCPVICRITSTVYD